MTATTVPSTRPASATPDRDPARARRRAAVTAGVGYVLLFALAIFANFAVFETMVVADDPAATLANIAADPLLFRLAIVAFLAVFVIDIVVAWALHVVFRTVDADRSLLTAWSRLAYTVFLGVALVFAVWALTLAEAGPAVAALDEPTRAAQAMLALQAFDTAWLVGLVAFGLHLALLGTLVLRSGAVARLLGWLLVVAGVAYAVDTVAHLVLSDYEAVAGVMLALVAIPSMLAEGWLGLWLLLRAGREQSASDDDLARAA